MGAITSEKHRGPHADDNAHGAICTSPTRADVTSRWQHSSCSARLPGAARRAVQPHYAGLAPLAPPRQSAEEEADPERTRPGLSTHGGAEPGQDAPPPPPAAARGLAARTRLRGDGVRTALPAMPSPIGIGAAGIRTRTPTPHPARPRPVPGPAQGPPRPRPGWPLPTWPRSFLPQGPALARHLAGTHTPAPAMPPLLPDVSARGTSPPQRSPCPAATPHPASPLRRRPPRVHLPLLEDCCPGPRWWQPCVGHLRGACAAR